MKKIIKLSALLLLFVQIFCSACGYTNTEEKPALRVHVRADSDSVAAQSVKREIACAIDCYLSSEIGEITDYSQMLAAVRARLSSIEAIAQGLLRRRGFGYGARVTLTREEFAERRLGDEIIPAGEYDSLTVLLGSASGDNWWTVIYPSEGLCDNVRYKSIIADILKG